MTYSLKIDRNAKKEMRALPDPILRRIGSRIRQLQEDPRRHGSTKLRGAPAYRARVGDYRILYQIDDREGLIVVEAVLHRSQAYRQ